MRTRTHLLGRALAALTVLLVFGCGGDNGTSPQPPTTVKEDPSFSADIQPIFTSSCVSSGCHGAAASAGLVLLQGQSYGSLVNVDSSQDNTKKRVLPGDADNSYIVIKLEGRQSIGARMPLGGSLGANSIQNVKNWIGKGAKNN
jgi:hypothetical protein